MGLNKPSDDVVFVDSKLKRAWEDAQKSEPKLAKQLLKAKKI